MIQFTIRDLLWLMVVVCLGLAAIHNRRDYLDSAISASRARQEVIALREALIRQGLTAERRNGFYVIHLPPATSPSQPIAP